MKRYGNLFDGAFSIDNFYCAYLDARRGKRKKQACFNFGLNLGENLYQLRKQLYDGTYKPQPYHIFYVYEPKKRVIYAPAFEDIVVQHAIYRIIYDIFDHSFIDTSFACRKGYGTHKASDYTQQALRKYDSNKYTLKLDVRHFFYTINRDILRHLLEKKVKDKRFVDIMMLFADSGEPLGIPIGNLLSQIYALIYLNPLDHYIKRVLKIKHYVRYVDDFILIGLSRNECLDYRNMIVEFLRKELNLTLSKSTIQKIRKGLNFCGYRTWRTKRFIRKYSLYKFKRLLKKNKQESVVSLLGHAKKTNSLPYMLGLIRQHNETKNIQISIPKNYRSLYYALDK